MTEEFDSLSQQGNIQGSPVEREAEATRLSDILGAYDFATVIPHLAELKPPLAGRPLSPSEFENSGVHTGIRDMAEVALVTKPIAILAAPLRVGKTSTLFSCANRATNAKFLDLSDVGYPLMVKLLKKSDYIALDELNDVPATMHAISAFVQTGKKIVISPRLHVAAELEHALHQAGIDFAEIPLPPLSEQKMQSYIGNILQLPLDNDLVTVFTRLSGGNLLLANTQCANLMHASFTTNRKEVTYDQRSFAINLLRSITIAYSQHAYNWNLQKASTDERFHLLFPNPLWNELLELRPWANLQGGSVY